MLKNAMQTELDEWRVWNPFWETIGNRDLLVKISENTYCSDDRYSIYLILIPYKTRVKVRCRAGYERTKIKAEDFIIKYKESHPELVRLIIFNIGEFE